MLDLSEQYRVLAKPIRNEIEEVLASQRFILGPKVEDFQNREVRAIIPVHLFGLCCEMDQVHVISEKYGLEVIEDAAQAIGAEYDTAHMGVRKAGTMGEVGFFSFYPSKNLGAAGDAGLIVCQDQTLESESRDLRQRRRGAPHFLQSEVAHILPRETSGSHSLAHRGHHPLAQTLRR